MSFEDIKIPGPKVNSVVAAILGVFIMFFLYQGVGGLITYFVFGADITKVNITSYRIMTSASQFLLILLPSLLLSKLFFKDIGLIIKTKIPSVFEIILFVSGLFLLLIVLQNFIIVQNYIIEVWAKNNAFIRNIKNYIDFNDNQLTGLYSYLIKTNGFLDKLLVIFIVAVTPAICEEMFFRGYVQGALKVSLKPLYSSLITALFFSLNHFNIYGFLSLFALSLYFSYSVNKSSSIFISILLHFTNNFISVLVFFIVGKDELFSSKIDINTVNIVPNATMFLTSLILFLVLIYYIEYAYKTRINKKEMNHDLSEM